MEVETDCVGGQPLITFTVLSLSLAALLIIPFLLHSTRVRAETSMIRLSNESGFALENVYVNGVSFGDVAAGAVSRYQGLTPAYRYARLQLGVSGKKFEIIPDDFVGETQLGKGSFTYGIQKQEAGGAISFHIQATKDAN